MTRRSVVPSVSRRAASSACSAGGSEPVLGALAHVGRELLEEERIAARPRHHLAQRRLGQRQPGARAGGGSPRRPAEPGAGPSPAAHAGRAASSSGRPTHSSRTGAASGPSASWSMRSSSAGSAQWASSKASTSAVRAASAVSSIRKAHGAASAEACRPEAEGGRDRRRRRTPVVRRRHDRGQRPPAQRLEHHLAQRPVGDAVAVGGAVADQHLRVGRRVRARARGRAATCRSRARRARVTSSTRPARRTRATAASSAASSRSRPASGVTSARRERSGVEQGLHRLAESQLSDVGCARQPRSRSDDVARRQRVVARDERCAGGHAEADVERHALALELDQPPLERGGGPDGAQPVVLVARADAEDGHEPVGQALDHRVAVAAQHGRRLVGAAAHHLLEHLRIERPDLLGAAHVGRDADDLAPRRERVLALDAVEQPGEPRRRFEAELVGQRAPRARGRLRAPRPGARCSPAHARAAAAATRAADARPRAP